MLAKTDPMAACVAECGGTLIRVPRLKANFAGNGCGAPTPVVGTGGKAPCGSFVTDLSGRREEHLCPPCENHIKNNAQDHRPLPDSTGATQKKTMENPNTPEHTTDSGSCASPCSAVVEIAGDNVSVTLHPTDAAAEAFAVDICMENTEYGEDEIRDHLKHLSAHAEGDYRVVLAVARFVSPNT
jgi:hypothetical protein